jgi:hypothetical protein
MPPKTPSELKEQLERQNKKPARAGHERTAEGLSVEKPSRGSFFANLKKAAEKDPDSTSKS